MNKKFLIAGLLWIICISAGFTMLYKYSLTPGKGSTMKGHDWPKNSKLTQTEKPILLIFAHPYCPCSTATIGELERLMPELQNKVQVIVIFVQPEVRSFSWVQSSAWKTAKAIPGVTVMSDFKYVETDLFGAKTSGQVMFFDSEGKKIYSGGITPARGHMGDNVGRDMILAWLSGKSVKREIASVFGCSLKENY